MHAIFICFLFYGAKVIVKGDNESKYIDLLPEKEKQEFLEKIARRILEEVETRDEKPIGSSEIPAEQLNEQDGFVRRLLTEESKHIRKKAHAHTGTNLDVNATSSSMPAALRDEGKDKRQQIVDLTRRDGNRKKRENKRRVYTGYARENDNSTENHKEKTPQESDVDIQVKNFRKSINVDGTADKEGNNITINYATHTTEENMAIVKVQNNEYNITDRHHFNLEDKHNEEVKKVSVKEMLYSTDRNDLSELEKVTMNIDKLYETESSSHGNSKDFIGRKASSAETDASKAAENESVKKSVDLSINTNLNENERVNEKENNKTIERQSTSDIMLNVKATRVLRTSDRENNLSEPFQNDLKQRESPVTEVKEIKDSDIIKIGIAKIQSTNTNTTNDDVNDKENNHLRYEKYEDTTPMIELLTPVSIDKTIGSITDNQKDYLGTAKTESDILKITDESKIFLNKEVKSLRQDSKVNDKINEEPKPLMNKPQEYRVYEIASDDLPFNKQDLPKRIPKQKQSSFKKPTRTDIFESLQLRKPLQLNSKQLESLKQLIASIKPNEQRIHEKRLEKQPKSNLKGSTGNREPETIILEEPYYAPIYNHIPSNAFYNPLNVFGPNRSGRDENNEVIREKGDNLGYTFPSNKTNNDYNKNETNDHPFHVPIYYYSPKNAFYNSYNNFGPNADNNDPKAEVRVKHLDYDNDSYDDDNNYKEIKERNQIEWQYLHEPLTNNTMNAYDVKPNYKKAESNAFISNNLIEAVKNLILKGENKRYKYGINIIIPKGIHENIGNDSDWKSKKEKEILRRSYKKRCGTYVSEEKNSYEKVTENDELDSNAQFLSTTMSKVRHMLLESGHFMLVHAANTSKLDLLFDSAAEDVKAEGDKGDERNKSLRITIQPDVHKPNKEETFHTSNENIAIDYYERIKDYKSNTDAKEKDNFDLKTYEQDLLKQIYNSVKTAIDKSDLKDINLKTVIIDPPKLLYIKNSKDVTDKPNLRTAKKSKKKKSEGEVEFKFITDLAETMRDPGIIRLYLQMKSIMREGGQSDQNLDVYAEVLDYMIKENNIGLVGYDWLGTAVDLQSALKKLMDMMEAIQDEDDGVVHPSDLELLKYIVYLHRIARDVVDESASPNLLRGLKIHGGHKRHHAPNIIKESGLLYRAWLIRLRPKPIADGELLEFRTFLHRLQDHLSSLHTAIKHIATDTKYKDQRWLENLKQIHFDYSKRQLLEVVLHLALTRLFGLIEESSKNGLDDDFSIYAKNNEREVERTKEEFVFVLKVLDALDQFLSIE